MEAWEKERIRTLAKEKKEISHLPVMEERAKLWTKHNNLQGTRPMIHFEAATVQDAGFFESCQCTSPEAVNIEWQLITSMVNHKQIDDDRVVTDEFVCLYHIGFLPFNMPIKKTYVDSGVGFHIESQIESLEDMSWLKPSVLQYDMEGTLQWKSFVEEQIGDILPVRLGMNSFCASMTNEIVHRMGMDNMFMAMYDSPDAFHLMMDTLANDYINLFKGAEERGMICANNKNDWITQGSFGYTDDLPDTAVKTTDCWGYIDSQETVGVSTDMFHEFFYPYYKRIADVYGLLSYGCCEPVSDFWEKSLSGFENLRKISISPWCDEEYMGQQLKTRPVIYQRKPSPNFVGVGKELDEEGFRKHIRQTLEAARDCRLEITFRDVYNLEGRLDKPRRAVEIVREETGQTDR